MPCLFSVSQNVLKRNSENAHLLSLAFVSLSRFLFKWEKLFNFVRTRVTEAWFILTRLNAGAVKHLDTFPLMGFYFEQLIHGSLAFTEKTQNIDNSNVESPINNMCQQTSPINLHLNLHLTFRRNRWRYLWFSSSILTGMQQSNRLLVGFIPNILRVRSPRGPSAGPCQQSPHYL